MNVGSGMEENYLGQSIQKCLGRPYHFKFFKGCLPQILLVPFLNTLSLEINSLRASPKKIRPIILRGFLTFQRACISHWEACFFITVKQCKLV